MRSFISVIVLAIVQYSCQPIIQDNDLKSENLNGSVKSVSEMSYKSVEKQGSLVPTDIVNKVYFVFNKQGNLVYKTYQSFSHPSAGQVNLKYDLSGNLIEQLSSNLSGDTLTDKSLYTYDSQNRKITEKHFSFGDNENYYGYTYKYDAKDNITERTLYKENGNPTEKSTYRYDDKNRVDEIEKYTFPSELPSKEIVTYEDGGKLITRKTYFPDGGLYSTSIKKNNDAGKCLEDTYRSPSNNLDSYSKYTYDIQGNLTEYFGYENGKMDGHITQKYEYDSNNNWIKKTVFFDDEEKGIIVREINYYSKVELYNNKNIASTNDKLSLKPINEEYFEKSFKQVLKEENLNTNLTSKNIYEDLSNNNLYKNKYFNISIKFPDQYEIDRGNGEHTVIRALNKETATSIALNVIPLKTNDHPEKIQDDFQREPLNTMNKLYPGGYEAYFLSQLKQITNGDISELKLFELKMGEVSYLIASYKDIPNFNTGEVSYVTFNAMTYINNVMFLIGYSAPDIYIDENLFYDVVKSCKYNAPE
jgi:hypothetical protein